MTNTTAILQPGPFSSEWVGQGDISRGRPNQGDTVETAVAVLAMALIVIWPYSFILAMRTNLNVMGYSLFVTVGPAVIALLGWSLATIRRPVLSSTVPIIAAMSAVALVYVRWSMGLSESSDVNLKEIVGNRYLVMLPCYLIMARAACKMEWFRHWAPRIVILNGTVSAALAIGYVVGMVPPALLPSGDDTSVINQSGDLTRASGLFAGSNVFGNFLVIPLMLCVLTKLKSGTRIAACAILFAGAMTSQSRTAVVTAAVAILWLSWKQSIPLWKRVLQAVFVIAAILVALQLVQTSVSQFRYRVGSSEVDMDAATRVSKTMLGIHALFSDGSTILAGARPSEIVVGEGVDQQISDNSYIQVLVSLGLPLGILFGCFLLWLISDHNRMRSHHRRLVTTFFGVVLSAALLNNSIAWDIYVFHAAVLYWLLVNMRVPAQKYFRRMRFSESYHLERHDREWTP